MYNDFACFRVDVDEDDIITFTAPIAWKWKGKHVEDLIRVWKIQKVEEI